jgi:hypothetical protein
MTINGKKTAATRFAYDGCHKIYLLESEEDAAEAKGAGYGILPISKLKEVFDNSCGLQFISNWGLNKQYVSQCERARIKP